VSKIKKALSNLRVLLKCNIVSVKIDNIIATTDTYQQINLRKLLKDQNFKIKKYNNEIFPGLFAKFKKGTAIIFHSGKVVIVGCKKLHHIPWIIQQITRHI
jgi:TATA-box binding protein (TBP) (component of TFIID and TFIIIB)